MVIGDAAPYEARRTQGKRKEEGGAGAAGRQRRRHHQFEKKSQAMGTAPMMSSSSAPGAMTTITGKRCHLRQRQKRHAEAEGTR